MKWPVRAKPAAKPRSSDVVILSTFYAAIITVMAVAQLFTFEAFILHNVSLDLPGGRQAAYMLSSAIIAAEILSLPFLLRMTLSSAFRFLSMVCSWLVAVTWLFVSLWIILKVPEATTVGFFGTALETMPGWWAVFISMALGILAAWASWGMWPGVRRK